MHILVAEDTAVNAILIKNILERDGFKVTVAKDGVEALEALEANPDIGLGAFDIRMPRMGGLDLAREIRQRPDISDLPIVFISAVADMATVQAAVALRSQGYILKPIVEPSRVLDKVRAALDSQPKVLEDEERTVRRLGLESKIYAGLLEAMLNQLTAARAGIESGAPEVEALREVGESAEQLGAQRLAANLAEYGGSDEDKRTLLREIDALTAELAHRGIEPTEWNESQPEPASPSEATS